MARTPFFCVVNVNCVLHVVARRLGIDRALEYGLVDRTCLASNI
jgi:hypothetical protein